MEKCSWIRIDLLVGYQDVIDTHWLIRLFEKMMDRMNNNKQEEKKHLIQFITHKWEIHFAENPSSSEITNYFPPDSICKSVISFYFSLIYIFAWPCLRYSRIRKKKQENSILNMYMRLYIMMAHDVMAKY